MAWPTRPTDAEVTAAIGVLASLRADDYERHLRDQSRMAHEMSQAELDAWAEMEERLRPLVEAWIQEGDDPDCTVWQRIVLALLRRADTAEAALISGPDAEWFARLVKVTERAEDLERELAGARASHEGDDRLGRETVRALGGVQDDSFGAAFSIGWLAGRLADARDEIAATREVIQADNWPLGTEDGSGFAPLADIVRTIVSHGRRCERDLAAEREAHTETRKAVDLLAGVVDSLAEELAEIASCDRVDGRAVISAARASIAARKASP